MSKGNERNLGLDRQDTVIYNNAFFGKISAIRLDDASPSRSEVEIGESSGIRIWSWAGHSRQFFRLGYVPLVIPGRNFRVIL